MYLKYRCTICGHIYDEEKEKTLFKDLPDDWKCPLCGALKSDFVPVEDAKAKKMISEPVEDFEDMEGLTVSQMSALCSNLARGCEKQYRFDDMRSFTELAEYFGSISPAVNDGKVEDIASRIMSDVNENYPGAVEVCSQEADRGAWRICVWGEKVTRMLNSLVKRYLEEGEDMLKDTQIWVCTICGFVYVGDLPPEMCPVCKVPSWKFQKMEAKA